MEEPGITACSILVFVRALGARGAPGIMGGSKPMKLGNLIEI